MRLASVAVLTLSSVLEDRSSIKTPANVSALNRGHSAEMAKIWMTSHVNAHVPIDQRTVPTLKLLITTFVSVAALTHPPDAQVDRGSMQALANVSAPNQSQHAHRARSLIPTHVSASAQIDRQRAVPMLRFSTTSYADVSVPRDIDVPVDISLMKTSAHANVPILDHIVTSHRFSTVKHVGANVHTNQHVNLRTNSIPTRVLATASPNPVHPHTTLSTNLVAASVVISTLAPSTRSLTKRPVNVSVPELRSVDLHNDSTRKHVDVSAPVIAPVWPIRISTATGAGASASRAINTSVEHTMYLTTIVVTVYVIVTVLHRMF